MLSILSVPQKSNLPEYTKGKPCIDPPADPQLRLVVVSQHHSPSLHWCDLCLGSLLPGMSDLENFEGSAPGYQMELQLALVVNEWETCVGGGGHPRGLFVVKVLGFEWNAASGSDVLACIC